jgi:translocation and assembly module TamB
MRWLRIIVVLVLTTGGASQAQTVTEAEAGDGTRLEQFLEEQLSDEGRFEIGLTGFRGALSSNASLDRLTISDAAGVWLVLEEAELVWTRSALLRGRLEIDSLTAARLQVLRQPVQPNDRIDLPTAEATPFSLPELPVSINIGAVEIAAVILSEDIVGRQVRLSVAGAANLEDGSGAAELNIIRLDGPRGLFDLSAAYANATRELAVSLLVEEDAGGLVSELAALPGDPALRLAVTGSGPITGFGADIVLDTDGQRRLEGEITALTDRESGNDDQQILVDLGGDISPLLQPEYRGFFGDDIRLSSAATLFEDGRIRLHDLSLASAALSLTGSLSLDSRRQPERFALLGMIRPPDGARVRLPVPGREVSIAGARLDIGFDATDGDEFRADFDLRELDADGEGIEEIAVRTRGVIRQHNGLVSSIRADVISAAEGVRHSDPALAAAIGPDLTVQTVAEWATDQPLSLTDLALRSGDLSLGGDLAFDWSGATVMALFDLQATAENLARFAAVANQPLQGTLDAALTGQAELLSGAFDMRLAGSGRDLQLVEALPPALLADQTDLTLDLRRDETGLGLDGLSLENAQISLSAEGRLATDSGALTARLRLANLGLFNDFVSGPAVVNMTLDRQDGGPWGIDANATGPEGIAMTLAGTVALPDVALDLRAQGRLPLALANPSLAPRSVAGTLGFNVQAIGPPSLAALNGRFSTSGARISLPSLQTAVEDVSLDGSLSASRVSADIAGNLASGGRLTATTSVDLGRPSLPISAQLSGRGLRLIDPTLYELLVDRADIDVGGAILGTPTVSGTVTLGQSEIRVPETGLGATDIPEIRHTGETAAQFQTRVAAGLGGPGASSGAGSGRPVALNVTVTAPGRIFLRGRGLDAELGGQLRLGGTSANLLPTGRFDLLRGRLSILGTRLDLTEGSATLQGNFDPFVRLLATSRAGAYTISINVIGPVTNPSISFTSDPSLPEDEVLAQLLFGRSVSALSPVQLIQLADAAASLAGGAANSGILSNLRDGLGLDDLDLQTDEEGNAAVRAGRYISDNVYTDLTISGSGETDLSLNIDLTPSVTARGSVSSDGDGSLGLFFERDY